MGPLNHFKHNMRGDVGCRDQKQITDRKIMSANLEIYLFFSMISVASSTSCCIIELLCFESLRWRSNLKLLLFFSCLCLFHPLMLSHTSPVFFLCSNPTSSRSLSPCWSGLKSPMRYMLVCFVTLRVCFLRKSTCIVKTQRGAWEKCGRTTEI